MTTMRKEEADKIWAMIEGAQKAAEAEEQLSSVRLDKELDIREQKLLEKFNLKRVDGRIEEGKRRKKKAAKRKRDREYIRRYRMQQRLTVVDTGDWWPILVENWYRRKLDVQLTRAEWEELVMPHVLPKEAVSVQMYNRKGPVSWDNIWVEVERLNEEKQWRAVVVYDGAEESLKALGYCL